MLLKSRWVLIPLILFRLILQLQPYGALKDFQNKGYSLPIYSSDGELLYITPKDDGLLRERVDLSLLETVQIEQVLTSEDRYFYYHYGVNPISLFRAIGINREAGYTVTGASTISMQLARIITPRDKSIKSKIAEMWDAMRLEAHLSKREILELYLSYIPFGRNIEGYQSISRYYFNRPLDELSESEIATLSIIPRNPQKYDPFKSFDKLQEGVKRVFPHVTLAEFPYRGDLGRNPIRAPHYVYYIIGSLTKDDYITGRPIETSLNWDIQDYCEGVLSYYLERTRENRVRNGAVLLKSGDDIVAYLGSGDFFDSDSNGQIDGVQILRQPGSTLKPFLYELAFEMGYTPASIIPDIPTDFGTYGVYRPQNYSQTYHGPVRVRTALASSLNIPAVYMLERVGVHNFIERLKALGFNSLIGQEEQLGLGLAVGNAEVSLMELVNAFSQFRDTEDSVMDPLWASLTRDILSDRDSRVLGFGRNSVLNTSYPSYFKTGTSNQFNNIWALGVTSDLTCGVWMGNFTGETVIGQPGSSIPARIANDILDEFSKKEEFKPLTGFVKKNICDLSGGLAKSSCRSTVEEYFYADYELEPCSFHDSYGRVDLPSIYREWIGLYNYSSFHVVDNDDDTVINLPLPNAVYFYRDDIPMENQGIGFDIDGRGPFSLTLNDSIIINGNLPFKDFIGLPRGDYSYLLSSNNNSYSGRFIIK